MDYNKSSEPMRLREYGRNVQKMIEKLKTVEDDRLRNRLAQETIRVMNLLTPVQLEPAEQKRKLWEQMFQIADYELEVEAPFEIVPPAPTEAGRPGYYPHRSRYKQYGTHIALMVQKAVDMPDSPEKDQYVLQIANIMKLALHNYESGAPNDAVVFEHLAALSGGRIQLSPEGTTLKSAQAFRNLQQIPNAQRPYSANRNKGGGGQGQGQNNKKGGDAKFQRPFNKNNFQKKKKFGGPGGPNAGR